MHEPQSFQRDCIELAQRKFARGEIDRRAFLGLMAGLGVSAGLAGQAQAQQPREVVMVNWGGIANEAFGRFYGQPFMQANAGVRVTQDSSGPSAGRIRSMVESRRVTWDLCDSSSSSSILLGGQNLLEPINYRIINREDLLPQGFALPHGAAPYSFSSVLLYDAQRFAADPPKNWADFLNFQKYPGKRMLRRDALASLDALLMGEGVAPEQMYPLNTRRGLDILRRIRSQCVYWNSGSESEQLMRTGEATMGLIWHTRAKVLHEETNGRLTWTWNQGVLQAGIFVIPRGNPSGELAQRVLASACSNAEQQVGLLGFLGNGPTNPRAAAAVPQNLRRFNPTDPENARVQLALNGEWWGQNYAQANQDYLDLIAG